MSKANRINCARKKGTHTTGTKSFARKREELKHLDEPLSETNNVQPTGKRKRVYSELHSADLSLLQDVNDTKMDQIEDEGSEDEQGRGKLNTTQDKRKAPNAQQGKVIQGKTVSTVQKMDQIEDERREDRQGRNKLNKTQDNRKATNTHQGKVIQGKTVTAVQKAKTMQSPADDRFDTSCFAKAVKPSITERPTQEDILTGSEVRIMSWRNPSKIVALGRVLARDPNTRVGGCRIGNEFWMLRVGITVVPKEPLIRAYNNFEFIGDVGRNPIAWPSSCVQMA
ncbi:hypothetical protein BS78_04G129700 [Paspalum vaginatum]|nr:hypothetical protein BS78_04G129700 [Paspalum vaginatum]